MNIEMDNSTVSIPSNYTCSSDMLRLGQVTDRSGDLCKSIVSFRTLDVDERLFQARMVIFATVDNQIYMMDYEATGVPNVIVLTIPKSEEYQVVNMDVFGYSTIIVQQERRRQQPTDSYDDDASSEDGSRRGDSGDEQIDLDRLSVFDVTILGRLRYAWSVESERIVAWKVIASEKNAFDPVYGVLTREKLQFYDSNGKESCTLRITGGNVLGFDWVYQWGRFDVWQQQNAQIFPMRFSESVAARGILSKRFLIFIYDYEQVRMIHYGSLTRGNSSTCHNQMDLSDKSSVDSRNSLVWTIGEHGSDSVTTSITTIKPFTSMIRDPIIQSDELVTCSNIRYPPSQQVYLSVGVTMVAADIRLDTFVKTIHLEELSMVDFDKYSAICDDDKTPNPSSECVFNPAMRTVNYEYDNCEQCAQQSISIDYDWIDQIESRFIDVPLEVNGIDSYQRNGTLEPFTVCEHLLQYTKNVTLHMKCVELITMLYTNSTLGRCDPILLNMRDDLIQPFFSHFWQDNLFILARNFHRTFSPSTKRDESEVLPVINPSVVHIVAKTMSLSTKERFGNFTLSLMNTITASGRALDMHVSPNGQHLYLAQTRYRYEMESLERFNEICSMLNEGSDSPILSKYKQYCINIPPSPVDIRQFGMISSSCSSGVLCGRFTEYEVELSIEPGHFVFNHLSQVPCPPGVYCSHGIIHPCPKGFLCNEPGLPAPRPCPLDDSDDTCYVSPLTSTSCPFGAVCPVADQPPVLAPPGYALWIYKYGVKVMGKDLKACEPGDYCPLALQVTAPALNYDSEEDSESTEDPDEILHCPANAYCANSSILSPEPCYPYNDTSNSTVMPYCPSGSSSLEPCPAGHYCPNPSSIKNCSKAEYCPAGSFLSDVCKEGYYCPDPTQKIKCPAGFFCRQGSTSPVRCSFLGHCPAGSSKDPLTSFAVGVVVGVLILILIAYSSFRCYVSIYKKISRKQRLLEIEEQKRKSMIRQTRRKISMNARPTEKTALLTESDYDTETEIDDQTESLLRTNFTADIQFEELGLVLRSTGKRVLHGVTGEIRHGELTCVMGLSGAGKSTFITTLAGRAHYGIPEGIIRVNGVERKLTSFNLRVGFVPQEDIMCRDCTVEDTLLFAAKTRLDRRTTNKQITQIVNNVIHVLRLEDIRHSLIGDETNRGISGGQRKRVNVGIELVAQPVILFCDEPTSGLDSASSKEVCEVLQDIAKSGITVITVIHQPRYEIFEMFEQLLLLGKGGKTAYLGPVNNVRQYFESMGFVFPPQVNVADYLMDITAGNALPTGDITSHFTLPYDPEQLQEKWKLLKTQTEYVSHFSTQIQQTNTTHVEFVNPSLSYIRQFWMCFLRGITQQIRAITDILQDFFLAFICGLLLGLIFYNKTYTGAVEPEISNQCPKALRSLCEMPLDDPVFKTSGMTNLAMALTGVMAGLKVFGREKVVFERESQTGLSTFCYFWSKDIAVLPMNILAPWIFLIMYYTLLDPRAQLYEIYYVLLLIYWTSYGLGYLVSVIINNVNAQLFAVVIVFILNIVSGSTSRLKEFQEMSPPFNILPYASYLTYGLEMNYMTEIVYYKEIYNINRSLDLFGYKMSDMQWTWAALLGYGLLFRVMAFIALRSSRPSSLVLKMKNTLSNWVLVNVKNFINRFTPAKVAVVE